MSVIFEWWRDVPRYEQVRAAEDAAAVPSIQHRDLPEQVALLWASVGDIIGRVVRLEGEMDAGQDEEAAPAVCDSVPLANGLRTERVTPPWQRAKWDEALAIICDGGDWGRGNNFDHGVLGALVIWADKEMDRLTAERDLARAVRDGLRSQRDAARARVAELEAAQATLGSGDVFADVGCGSTGDEIARLTAERDAAIRERDEARRERDEARRMRIGFVPATTLTDLVQERDATRAECERLRARVAELEAAPPPRGWLTEEERELIAGLTDDDDYTEEGQNIAKALLARSTPPRVKGPTGWAYDAHDMAWIAAIRAAGGEVADE